MSKQFSIGDKNNFLLYGLSLLSGGIVIKALYSYLKKTTNKTIDDITSDVPNIDKEDFVKIMKKYNDDFSKSLICEKLIPRKFDESTLNQFCNQLNYTKKGENDVEAVTKVNFQLK